MSLHTISILSTRWRIVNLPPTKVRYTGQKVKKCWKNAWNEKTLIFSQITPYMPIFFEKKVKNRLKKCHFFEGFYKFSLSPTICEFPTKFKKNTNVFINHPLYAGFFSKQKWKNDEKFTNFGKKFKNRKFLTFSSILCFFRGKNSYIGGDL